MGPCTERGTCTVRMVKTQWYCTRHYISRSVLCNKYSPTIPQPNPMVLFCTPYTPESCCSPVQQFDFSPGNRCKDNIFWNRKKIACLENSRIVSVAHKSIERLGAGRTIDILPPLSDFWHQAPSTLHPQSGSAASKSCSSIFKSSASMAGAS